MDRWMDGWTNLVTIEQNGTKLDIGSEAAQKMANRPFMSLRCREKHPEKKNPSPRGRIGQWFEMLLLHFRKPVLCFLIFTYTQMHTAVTWGENWKIHKHPYLCKPYGSILVRPRYVGHTQIQLTAMHIPELVPGEKMHTDVTYYTKKAINVSSCHCC